MKKIKIWQLLNRYSDEKILKRFVEKYPDQKSSLEGYQEVLNELRLLSPVDGEETVYCQKFGCHMIKPGDDLTWAFGPIGRGHILGMNVGYANLDFICNLLWEITFYGFTQKENKNFFNEIFNNVKELK